jgi:TPR repeat protein
MKLNYPFAYVSYGLLNLNGLGEYQQDYAKARAAFLQAAKLGNPRACYLLGRMYDDCQGIDVDRRFLEPGSFHPYTHIAMHWYIQALKNGGHETAQHLLMEFRRALIIEESGIPWDEPLAIGPKEVVARWKKDFPESYKEFETRFPRPARKAATK